MKERSKEGKGEERTIPLKMEHEEGRREKAKRQTDGSSKREKVSSLDNEIKSAFLDQTDILVNLNDVINCEKKKNV